MTKLWNKGYQLNETIEKFMTSDDPILDLRIAQYDCLASIAHAKMLVSINIITQQECELLIQKLNEIIFLLENKEFTIDDSLEDIHTSIENYLVRELGDIGKKIHTARSRNDQVLTAIRLYSKDELKNIILKLTKALDILYEFTHKYQYVPYAGRTHFQKAMPSSMGLWMGAFIESLLDDAELLINSYKLINQSPLGSAAGYGVAITIDRQFTSDMLGFANVQNNVLYVNNSRGKFESIIIHALSQIMLDLSKLATDIIIFSAPEFAYLELPLKFCPGSSLMPNKKNPDLFELIRARSATVIANLWQTLEISRALPSGYNRDFQETKRPLFDSFDIVKQSLDVLTIAIAEITVNEEKCIISLSPEVFATDETLQLTISGVPFRDAYYQVAKNLDELQNHEPVENIKSKTHIGAPGNLGLDLIKTRIEYFKHINL